MNETQLKNQLRPLLDAMINDTISEADYKKLDQMLLDSREARDYYREYMDLAFEIRQAHIGGYARTSLPDSGRSVARKTAHFNIRLYQAALIAASFVIATMIYLLISEEEGVQPDRNTLANVSQEIYIGFADLRFLQQVTFEPDFELEEGRLGAQPLKLKSGQVSIRLDSGIELLVEGPADLTVRSETQCELALGKLLISNHDPDLHLIITTPKAEVRDIGTRYGLVVNSAGELKTHVFEGAIELTNRSSQRTLQVNESQSALLNAKQEPILLDSLDSVAPIFNTFKDRKNSLLRLQFDCGTSAGIYSGTNSPAHQDGYLKPFEVVWNPIAGNQSGTMIAADGHPVPVDLTIEMGGTDKNSNEIDWQKSLFLRKSPVREDSVFDTMLGRDSIDNSFLMAMRVRGLPAGRYRIYFIGRNVRFNPNWGDYGKNKAYDCAIDLGLMGMPQDGILPIDPIKRPNSDRWVQGQTHVVKDIAIASPSQWLTMVTQKNSKRSPKPKGSKASIVGFQIIQLDK